MLVAINKALDTAPDKRQFLDCSRLNNLELRYDKSLGILWKYISKMSTPYFSHEQLDEIRTIQRSVREMTQLEFRDYRPSDVRYLVFGSRIPNVFSLGGDLKLLRDLITRRDRAGLARYSRKATNAIFHHAANGGNVVTFSLVQGTAMGGGFEAALAGNVIVAERGTRLGFPEVLFGLFPGMGAYTLLRRRVNSLLAEKIILSAKNYCAEELYSMGVVDILCEPGDGERAISSYVTRQNGRSGAIAFRKALSRAHILNRKELYSIADDWIETAFNLPTESIKKMDRLINSQRKLYGDLRNDTLTPMTIRYVPKA